MFSAKEIADGPQSLDHTHHVKAANQRSRSCSAFPFSRGLVVLREPQERALLRAIVDEVCNRPQFQSSLELVFHSFALHTGSTRDAGIWLAP